MLSLEENKPIRSYVLRSGRITAAQKRAIEKYWPKWGLDPSSDSVNPQIVFGRDSKTILEIGFGQKNKVIKLLKKKGFYINSTLKDFAKNDRCIVCTRI